MVLGNIRKIATDYFIKSKNLKKKKDVSIMRTVFPNPVIHSLACFNDGMCVNYI